MAGYNSIVEPREITQPDQATLEVRWSDGHASRYTAPYLRQVCPCAGCGDEHRHPSMRPLPLAPEPVTLVNVGRVGRYAVSLTFSDGHSTGIYAFDFLRAQCPCAACQPSSAR